MKLRVRLFLRNYATKNIKTKRNVRSVIKDSVKTIVNKSRINPFSFKEQLWLSLSLIKSSISHLFRGIKNIDLLLIKNPIISPIYIIFKKIIVPLAILRYILNKFRLIRWLIWLGSIILANNFDLISINYDNIITTIWLIYDSFVLNFTLFNLSIKTFFTKVKDYIFNNTSKVKESIDTKNKDLYENIKIKRHEYHKARLDEDDSFESLRDKYVKNHRPVRDDSFNYMYYIKLILFTWFLLGLGYSGYIYWDDIKGWCLYIYGLSINQIYDLWVEYIRGNRGNGDGNNPRFRPNVDSDGNINPIDLDDLRSKLKESLPSTSDITSSESGTSTPIAEITTASLNDTSSSGTVTPIASSSKSPLEWKREREISQTKLTDLFGNEYLSETKTETLTQLFSVKGKEKLEVIESSTDLISTSSSDIDISANHDIDNSSSNIVPISSSKSNTNENIENNQLSNIENINIVSDILGTLKNDNDYDIPFKIDADNDHQDLFFKICFDIEKVFFPDIEEESVHERISELYIFLKVMFGKYEILLEHAENVNENTLSTLYLIKNYIKIHKNLLDIKNIDIENIDKVYKFYENRTYNLIMNNLNILI